MKSIIKLILLALCTATLAITLTACNIQDFIGGLGGNGGDGGNQNDDGNGDGDQNGDGAGDGENDGDGGEEEPDLDYYTVTLDNGTGKALTAVQVKLTDADGKEAAKVIVGMAGERVAGRADFVSVNSGSYDISLVSLTGAGIYYDKTTARIDETDKSVTIKVYNKFPEKSRDLMGAELTGNLTVPSVDAGYYYGTINKGMNYFVFNPTRDGMYEVKVRLDGATATIGNYGIPDYVLASVDTEGDGSISVEVEPLSEDGCPKVIGIDASAYSTGYVEIIRVSDLPPRPQYAPWITIQPTVELKQFDLPYDNVSLDKLDLTDPSLKVILGNDGYYHLGDANGEIVYVHISKPVEDGYLDGALTTIAGLQAFGHYVYDEDGNFLRKEDFTGMIVEYGGYCDENTGIYPLTEDMAYAIKSFGKSQGWFNLDSEDNVVFGEDASLIVKENAWLLNCVTLSLDETIGTTATDPLSLYSDGKIEADADTSYYFNVLGENITVTVKDADGIITVYANGTTYTAEGGEIEFTLQAGETTFYLVSSSDTLVEYTSNVQ